MVQERIFVSPYNFQKEVVKEEHLPEKIIINDVVLREEVKLDVELSLSQKVEIAQKLDELGVHQIQMHTLGVKELVPAIKKAGVKADLDALTRPGPPFWPEEYGYGSWQEEIDAAIEAGVDIVSLGIDLENLLALRWPKEKVLERVVEVVEYAKSKGAKCISFGVQDATRGRGYLTLDFHKEVFKAAAKHGAQRIGFKDSSGITRPSAMKWVVQEMKKAVGLPIQVHCHNDFGLATANVLASAEGGATILDVAINGLDRARSGVASLDEVVMSLLCLYGKDVGIRTERLWETARYFEKITGVPLSPTKPITGITSLSKRVDHALAPLLAGASLAFPFDPTLIGYKKSPINLGRGVGPVGIRHKLSELNLTVPEDRITELVEMVAAESAKKHRALEDEEFAVLVKKVG